MPRMHGNNIKKTDWPGTIKSGLKFKFTLEWYINCIIPNLSMSSKETQVPGHGWPVEKKAVTLLIFVAIWNHLLKGSRCIKQDAMTYIYFGCCFNKKLPYLWHVSSKAKVSSDKNVHNFWLLALFSRPFSLYDQLCAWRWFYESQ